MMKICKRKMNEMMVMIRTWKIPWIIFIDVKLLDKFNGERSVLNLPL